MSLVQRVLRVIYGQESQEIEKSLEEQRKSIQRRRQERIEAEEESARSNGRVPDHRPTSREYEDWMNISADHDARGRE